MSAAVLIYVDHAPNPNTICSICLDPVAQKAIKVSCHLPLSCAECMGYWFESLNHSKSKTACPCCRINVDTSNLQAPSASIEWHDVENMMMDESEPEDFWGEFEDESSFSDDEQSDEEDGDKTAQTTPVKKGRTSDVASEGSGSFDLVGEDDDELPEAGDVFDDEKPAGSEAIRKDAATAAWLLQSVPSQAAIRREARKQSVFANGPAEIYDILTRFAHKFPFEFSKYDTYFAPNLVVSSSLMVCAKHHIFSTSETDEYFFFVNPNTTITDMVALWVGDEAKDHLLEVEKWSFEGKKISWLESVGGVGMKHGSTFHIRGD